MRGCPQIKYVMAVIALQLWTSVFHIKERGALYPAERSRSLFPQEIMWKLRLWSKYSLYCLCWKSFFPSPPPPPPLSSHFFSPFPAKCFRTDGTTTFVFSDSLDSTCWWNGAFTLSCPCRCVWLYIFQSWPHGLQAGGSRFSLSHWSQSSRISPNFRG